MSQDIIFFIESLRESDFYIKHLFLNGSCYKFHLLLSKFYPGCEPWVNHKMDHVITKYDEKFYDIRGEVKSNGFRPLQPQEIKIVEKWSFHKINLLKLDECPFCDEPLTYNIE